MKNSLEKYTTTFLISFSIFVTVLLVEAVILAVNSQFKTPFVYFSLIPAFAITTLFSSHLKRDVKLLPKITVPVLLLILLVSLILIFYPHDTFGGRDEAIYSNYAMYLTQKSSLSLPSSLNNLPGNFVEKVRTWNQGYPIWLGTQKNLFGIKWMLRSNVIIIILGLSSFFLVSSYLDGNKVGLISTILFSSSMPFLWFSRETMSENLSFFLLWSIILFLLFFLKTKNHTYLIPIFICSWLFGLTRYEGFLLQFVLLFVLFLLLFLNKISLKKILVIITIYFLVLISNIYIVKDTLLPGFLKTTLPDVTFGIKRDISSLIPKNLLSNNLEYSTANTSNGVLSKNFPTFIFYIMTKYNFILPIFSIFLITTLFLVKFKKLDQSKKFFFIILILLTPEYYKLISPNVTIDQPWLYRRYMYALLPLGYLCFPLFLSQLKNKKLLIILSSIVFIINIVLSSPIFFLKNNWGLKDKMEEITKDITHEDLVIVDYRRPLGYYSPISYLTLQKGIRALYDWQVANYKIIPEQKVFNGIPYEKIFFLSASTDVKKNLPSFTFIKIREFDVDYLQLVPSCQLHLLKEEEEATDIYDYGTITLSSAVKYCSQPKNKIVKHTEKLYLYELTYGAEKN